jgi:hypothetical protein
VEVRERTGCRIPGRGEVGGKSCATDPGRNRGRMTRGLAEDRLVRFRNPARVYYESKLTWNGQLS